MTATRIEVEALFKKPLKELLFTAQQIHCQSFPCNEVQLSSLLSIKTGGCPENCAYCPQSAHYKTGLQRKELLTLPEVVSAASVAKAAGATRFCMGAAWREVKDGFEFDQVLTMVAEVRKLNLEVCCTLGMISKAQALRLKAAGLYAYNHNIDSSRDFYSKVISTRKFEDRLQTIQNVRDAGMTVCTGGIIGLGESNSDRIDFLEQLATLTPHPESVTVNALIPIAGTPLGHHTPPEAFDIVRVIATARCLMPKSVIRLSAGRSSMNEQAQFLCFLAGANSIFLGEKLLTSSNPAVAADFQLFQKTGLVPMALRSSP